MDNSMVQSYSVILLLIARIFIFISATDIDNSCYCFIHDRVPTISDKCNGSVLTLAIRGRCYLAAANATKCTRNNEQYTALTIRGKVVWALDSKVVKKELKFCYGPYEENEFRGVWLVTVGNSNWPSNRTLSTERQQKELLNYINMMQKLNMNALVFHIRPVGDAFYMSSLEPWSVYLTGKQGRAPNPLWDPLEFAIDECHQRGIEVHAWFNPYIAKIGTSFSGLAPNHMAIRFRKYAYVYDRFLWMDPGANVVQDHNYNVIMDVVSRYKIDGVHWDDYFYPYPHKGKQFPDNETYKAYKQEGGTLSLGDWRRNNVNSLIQRVYQGIKQKRKLVKFGISPFGLYKPGKPGGMPSPIRGMDPYEETYADSKLWLQKGWVDYLTPQLYWSIASPHQSYPTILKWWLSVNLMKRHIYTGNAAYEIKPGKRRKAWDVSEIERQVNISRSLAPRFSLGNVMFNAKYFLENVKNISSDIKTSLYQRKVKTPYMPWLYN